MPLRCRLLVLLATLLAGCGADLPSSTVSKKTPAAPSPTFLTKDDATKPKPNPEQASALVRKGLSASQGGDHRNAVSSFEQALAIDPTNRQALWQLATLVEQQAEELPRPQCYPLFLRAAELLRKLRPMSQNLSAEERGIVARILYNEASTLAVEGESARAVNSLAESIDAGFADIAHIEQDPDFDSIRRFNEFQFVIRRLEIRLVLGQLALAKPFRFDFRLHDLDDKAVTLGDFKGKVLVAIIWGTWNLPGRKEIPHLVELTRRYRAKGLEVVGLCDETEPESQARAHLREFVKEHGVPFACLTGDGPNPNPLPRFSAYPTTLFIDRTGTVRLMLAGYQPFSTLEIAAQALLGEAQKAEAKKESKAR